MFKTKWNKLIVDKWDPFITVKKVEEAGYMSALKGLSYNKNSDLGMMNEVSFKLAFKDHGHNKFLESIYVWLDVKAPRYWWQEADTYRLSTKQSQSSYITFRQTGIQQNHFEHPIDDRLLDHLNELLVAKGMMHLKSLLPEGFLQRRMWCMNYKCLRNIIIQRHRHMFPHWKMFVREIIKQVDHHELLPGVIYDDDLKVIAYVNEP